MAKIIDEKFIVARESLACQCGHTGEDHFQTLHFCACCSCNRFRESATLYADGFKNAILGMGRQGHKTLVCYDRNKCVEILMKRDGMDREMAEEYFSFNVVGAWVGEYTPVFVDIEDKGT